MEDKDKLFLMLEEYRSLRAEVGGARACNISCTASRSHWAWALRPPARSRIGPASFCS